MTDRLSLYNGALDSLGERQLASLTESRKPRRLLDSAWDRGAVDYCLKEAYWKFALRTQKLEYDTSVTVEFGHSKAFTLPADYLKTYMICSDDYFKSPLIHYHIEGGKVFADCDEIYLRYVSNHESYGGDFSSWTPEFSRMVEEYLASLIAHSLKNDSQVKVAEKNFKDARKAARNSDAVESPPTFKPAGSWSRSRTGGYHYGER